MLRRRLLLLSVLALAVPLGADELGHELAALHAARAGGRLPSLQSLYAEGRTLVQDEVVEVRMWAQRPNHLRVESSSPKRRVIQIYDGRHEPVIMHSDVEGGRPLRMSPAERLDFLANADFDGPLVDFAAKGHTVDYAGEDTVQGRKAGKVLVMGAGGDIFFLWLDAETREVVKRGTFRSARGQRYMVETFFGDFRDVGGVPQPHRIETRIGERMLYLMVLSMMEANPAGITEETFTPPGGWPEPARKP